MSLYIYEKKEVHTWNEPDNVGHKSGKEWKLEKIYVSYMKGSKQEKKIYTVSFIFHFYYDAYTSKYLLTYNNFSHDHASVFV